MNTQNLTARLLTIAATLLFVLLVAACGGQQDTQQQPAARSAAADANPAPAAELATDDGPTTHAEPGQPVTIAGVTVTPPASWRDLGAAGMRQAQFHLDPVGDDAAPGEVAVFYFGPQSGGGVEANLQRWIGQMSLPDGGDPAQAASRRSFSVGGMPAHVVALDGTYNAGGMGGMGAAGQPQPGFRLVGVVLEGPQGSLFFKLTGPRETANAMQDGLLTMVRGARIGG